MKNELLEAVNIPVINTRNNRTGVAERIDEGRWTVIFDDNNQQQDVTDSTFKRWYKVLDKEVEKLVEDEKQEQQSQKQNTTGYADQENPFIKDSKFIVLSCDVTPTRAHGSVNTETRMQYNADNATSFITIKDHDGFIVEVRVDDSNNTLQYKSPKASVGDTLTNYFKFTDVTLKQAKTAITQLRKYAREQLLSEYNFSIDGVLTSIKQPNTKFEDGTWTDADGVLHEKSDQD